MNKYFWASATALVLTGIAGCHKTQTTQSYEAVPVQRRNLVVSASASGAIEPVLTVDVKSKASGEIIGMNVQTGDDVKESQLLASIDPRIPRNNLAQSQANLQVAQAQLSNAKALMTTAIKDFLLTEFPPSTRQTHFEWQGICHPDAGVLSFERD